MSPGQEERLARVEQRMDDHTERHYAHDKLLSRIAQDVDFIKGVCAERNECPPQPGAVAQPPRSVDWPTTIKVTLGILTISVMFNIAFIEVITRG